MEGKIIWKMIGTGNENYLELTGGSSYRGFKLLGVNCIQ